MPISSKSFCKIAGIEYDVLVLELDETPEVLDSENAGRAVSVGAPMFLDRLGTFYGNRVLFGCKKGYEEQYDTLFNLLAYPHNDGVNVEIAHNQTTWTYDAYFKVGTRSVQKIERTSLTDDNYKTYWGSFECEFTPMEAQVTP